MRRSGYAADNGISYVLGDQLGSTSTIAGQNGTLQASNYYSPFGGNRGGSAFSDLTTKRFTGQYHEAGLPGGEGLSYYNARWYDAQLGRFVSPDTLVLDPSSPQQFNRFSYVSNNPINRTDPTGHYEACDDGPCRRTGDTRNGVAIRNPQLHLPIRNHANSGRSSKPAYKLASISTGLGIGFPDFEDLTEIGGDWLQHRSVQVFFAEFIRPGAEMEKPVSGARWLPNTNGYADLVYDDQVWEVKPDTSYYTESNRGTAQLAKYLTHMPGHVPGEFIPNFLVPYNDNTLIVVHSDLRRPGLLFYRAYASRNPLGDKLFERAAELLAALWAAERLSRLPKPNPPIGPVTP